LFRSTIRLWHQISQSQFSFVCVVEKVLTVVVLVSVQGAQNGGHHFRLCAL